MQYIQCFDTFGKMQFQMFEDQLAHHEQIFPPSATAARLEALLQCLEMDEILMGLNEFKDIKPDIHLELPCAKMAFDHLNNSNPAQTTTTTNIFQKLLKTSTIHADDATIRELNTCNNLPLNININIPKNFEVDCTQPNNAIILNDIKTIISKSTSINAPELNQLLVHLKDLVEVNSTSNILDCSILQTPERCKSVPQFAVESKIKRNRNTF